MSMDNGKVKIGKFKYKRNQVDVEAKQPVVVAVSSGADEINQWGMFQFPRMWKTLTGETIFLQIHYGLDTKGRAGLQKSAIYYQSKDKGKTWSEVKEDNVDFSPDAITFKDGEKVRFGKFNHDIQQAEVFIPSSIHDVIDLNELNLKSYGEKLSPNEYGINRYFKYNDIPEHIRKFRISRLKPGQNRWMEEEGIIDFPELMISATVKARVDDSWHDLEPRIVKPWPKKVVADENDTLYSTINGELIDGEKKFTVAYCISSQDRGKTWQYRGTIANQKDISTFGYNTTEGDLLINNNQLICIMRTDNATINLEDTRELMISRSDDSGKTWSTPEAVAPYSVRPQLVPLPNGITGIIYARPGVHLLFSVDGCKTFNTPKTIIGRHEEEVKRLGELMGEKNIYPLFMMNDTCGNTGHVITGEDRFLIAYSDFGFTDKEGHERKIIKVSEVIVNKYNRNGGHL